jgi:hypothetical protein
MDNMFQLLSAGGDVSMIALVFIMWKFDRRLLTLELSLLSKK